MTFDAKMARFCAKNNIDYKIDVMQFGLKRATIPCYSYSDMEWKKNGAGRLHGCYVDSWSASSQYAFTGYIYIFDAAEKAKTNELVKIREKLLTCFWLEYHNKITSGVPADKAGEFAKSKQMDLANKLDAQEVFDSIYQ